MSEIKNTDTPSAKEMAPAYEFVDSMVKKADTYHRGNPLWYGWALREAFEAGRNYEREKIRICLQHAMENKQENRK